MKRLRSVRIVPSSIILSFLLLAMMSCGTQRKTTQPAVAMDRQEYIARYSPLARDEMRRTGIPASITMAQALLESDNGNSYLAQQGNNHFGIKCHKDWTGKKIYYDDDKRHECFRKYASPEQSFKDHSDFLVNGSRYDFLFKLDPRDFKGWAKGLKKAGYATHPHYDKLLINIIEDNRLYELDDRKSISADKSHPSNANSPASETNKPLSRPDNFVIRTPGHPVYQNNRVDYILVRAGDTMDNIRKELDLLPWELSKYNELEKTAVLVPDQILYIQPKRNQAEAGFKTHTVLEGDTMYSIAQKYAIRLQSLYDMNHMKKGEEPEPGAVLKLRK